MSLKRCRRGSTPERIGVRGSRVPCTCPCHRESRSSRRRRALDGGDRRPDSALGGSLARLWCSARRSARCTPRSSRSRSRTSSRAGPARPAAPTTAGSCETVINLDVGTVHIQLHQNPPSPHSGRSILKAVIARHEPQALTVQIPGRDRHGDTARAYLSTAVRSAPHGVDGRVSLQSRMRLRSANSHASLILTNVSR
jgi:hypothetical protein